jgi:hypothetical protein
VPVTKPEVIARLALHGVEIEMIPTAQTMTIEMYRLVNPRAASGGAPPVFEGRHTLTTEVKPESRQEWFPAGSVRVPTDQPLGDLVVALLEPESTDPAARMRWFYERSPYADDRYLLYPVGIER